MSEGWNNPLAPESTQFDSVDGVPDTMVHALMVLPPPFATKAVDPAMAMRMGPLNAYALPVVPQFDSVDPDTLHALTMLPP